jgi:hypothetical protein
MARPLSPGASGADIPPLPSAHFGIIDGVNVLPDQRLAIIRRQTASSLPILYLIRCNAAAERAPRPPWDGLGGFAGRPYSHIHQFGLKADDNDDLIIPWPGDVSGLGFKPGPGWSMVGEQTLVSSSQT